MAHFAELDENNVVLRVLVVGNERIKNEANDEDESIGVAFLKSIFGEDTNWAQTSYWSRFRHNFAGLGHIFDEANDAFIPPAPWPSYVLNENYKWDPPTPYPDDGNRYLWDEETTSWVEDNPCPFPSWSWSEEEQCWISPKPEPEDASHENPYHWNEDTQRWNKGAY
ncbi:MAG: hypothetical protein CL489_03005 [Acidobacteria bacterium]|nr:hypothetical protein [Acidobacteriota bacterium]